MVLKLSKEKWEEAAAHAATAVVSDFRRRVWHPPNGSAVGLLFGCKYGGVLLKEPVCEYGRSTARWGDSASARGSNSRTVQGQFGIRRVTAGGGGLD